MPGASYADQIKCIARELALRKAVYPKRVNSGSMTPQHAAWEIATMEQVMATVKWAADLAAARTTAPDEA